jgi:hypothetical protein
VLDPDIARFIRETILEAYLTDTQRSSVLRADGAYERPSPVAPAIDAQQLLTART